jgi:ParB family transcriptional regulator, chromosome partitioning protein
MSKRRGLGKGLEALIPAGDQPGQPETGARLVPLEAIQPNPRQPRRDLDPEALRSLADSIAQHGLLQPVVVTPEGEAGFRLIAGERRLQAARLAGLTHVPVTIRHASELQRLALALVENLMRADLNPLEAADGYRQLIEEFQLSHEAVAEQVGKSRAAVTNTLRLLKLGPDARQALLEGRISEGHARSLLGLPNAQAQSAALHTILASDLSVRQAEELVRRLSGQRRTAPPPRRPSPEEKDLQDRLQAALGTRVGLRRGRRGGTITIRFFSDEELNALVDRLIDGPSEP